MQTKLTTTSNGLAFTLDTDPGPAPGWSPYPRPDFGPVVIVHDGDFAVASYYLSTLAESPERGVAITTGRYEKYRAIEQADLIRLIDEAKMVIAREKGTP